MSKFDGPEFINPSHTSFGQISGTYVNPLSYKENEGIHNKIPTQVYCEPGACNILYNLVWKDEPDINKREKQTTKEYSYTLNYKHEVKNIITTNEYEMKLIEDLLNFQGISSKSLENQLNEFIKRCKSLNKEKISTVLMGMLKINEESINENKSYRIMVNIRLY